LTNQNLQPVLTYPQLPVVPGYENVLKRVLFVSQTTGKFKMFEQVVELKQGHNYESTAGFFCQLRERVGYTEEGQWQLIDITPKDSTVLLSNLFRFNIFDLRHPSPKQLDEVNEMREILSRGINNWRIDQSKGINSINSINNVENQL
jgi:hypothetical protein